MTFKNCVSEKEHAIIGNNPEVTVDQKVMSLNAVRNLQVDIMSYEVAKIPCQCN